MDRTRSIQLHNPVHTATVTSAVRPQSAVSDNLQTLSGETMTVNEIVELASKVLIQPKLLNIPWWPILNHQLEQCLRDR